MKKNLVQVVMFLSLNPGWTWYWRDIGKNCLRLSTCLPWTYHEECKRLSMLDYDLSMQHLRLKIKESINDMAAISVHSKRWWFDWLHPQKPNPHLGPEQQVILIPTPPVTTR